MYDLHVHSNFSIDSKSSMEDMTLAAMEKNLKTICFADRIVLDFTVNKINLSFRTEDYLRNINQVKYKYLKEIEILAGLEIGMQPHLGGSYDAIIDKYPLDYIIMSVHSVDGKDIFIDDFLQDIDQSHALYLYYQQVYQCLEAYDNFDVLGLFDGVDRYLGNKNLSSIYQDHFPRIRDILSLLISKGKGLEVNSSALRFGLDYFHPKQAILELYREQGGEIITLGSSANSPEYIGHSYRKMERLLKELGFKYFYIYRDRKKIPINIS